MSSPVDHLGREGDHLIQRPLPDHLRQGLLDVHPAAVLHLLVDEDAEPHARPPAQLQGAGHQGGRRKALQVEAPRGAVGHGGLPEMRPKAIKSQRDWTSNQLGTRLFRAFAGLGHDPGGQVEFHPSERMALDARNLREAQDLLLTTLNSSFEVTEIIRNHHTAP